MIGVYYWTILLIIIVIILLLLTPVALFLIRIKFGGDLTENSHHSQYHIKIS